MERIVHADLNRFNDIKIEINSKNQYIDFTD